MTLQQLRYALAVGKYHSINEAATALFVTQPTISTSIKELEEEFGIKIFSRTNRGIEITTEGTEFLGFARQVVEQSNLLREHYVKDRKRMIRFTVSSQHYSFAVSSFIKLVNTYGMDNYDFCLRETRTKDIITDVHNLSADIGIIYLSSFNRAVVSRILKEEELVFSSLAKANPHVFIGVNNPLAKRKSVTFEDLMDMPYLCFEQGNYSADYFAEEMLKNVAGTKTIRVSDRATLFNLLLGLNGYTISSGIIDNELNSEVVSIPLESDGEMEIGVIKRKDVVSTPVMDAYIDFLKESLSISK